MDPILLDEIKYNGGHKDSPGQYGHCKKYPARNVNTKV